MFSFAFQCPLHIINAPDNDPPILEATMAVEGGISTHVPRIRRH